MRNIKYKCSILLILVVAYSTFNAKGQDSTKHRKIKILPVPSIGYSPETRTYIGTVSLFTIDLYNDSSTRKSNAKFEFNYTWNKQVIIESGWNYFTKNERWFLKGLLQFSKFPDLYYGIGSETPDSYKTSYESNRIIVESSPLKKILPSVFVGPNLKFVKYWDVKNTSNNFLNFTELNNAQSFGLGFTFLKDNRNSILSPTIGSYAMLSIVNNWSSSNYQEIILDVRKYHTIKNKLTIATRFINDLNFNNLPFYDYAILGGDRFVRGYYYGRFRDKNLSTLQTELRFPVIWRFGLAAFGGISQLYKNFQNFDLSNNKLNGGLGLRFTVDRKDQTNLRLDYAVGEGRNNGFYVAFGESF